ALFLFFATSNLISRSVDKWFSEPTIQMVMAARGIQEDYVNGEQEGLERLAVTLARLVSSVAPDQIGSVIKTESENQRLIIAQYYDQQGNLIAEHAEKPFGSFDENFRAVWRETLAKSPGGVTYSDENSKLRYLIATAAADGGRIII